MQPLSGSAKMLFREPAFRDSFSVCLPKFCLQLRVVDLYFELIKYLQIESISCGCKRGLFLVSVQPAPAPCVSKRRLLPRLRFGRTAYSEVTVMLPRNQKVEISTHSGRCALGLRARWSKKFD